MKNIVIFGVGRLSSLAWYVLTHDSNYDVVGFTVDSEYLKERTHEGLPVFPYEKINEVYPPTSVSVLVPTGFTRINEVRMKKYYELKSAGYELINYLSSRATTWPDLCLKDNCMVYENSIIQPFTCIGENTIIRSSVHVSHHCNIGNHCFLAAGVVLGGCVNIGNRSFLGLGSIVRDNIKIAERTFIGAGAVVVADTEPDQVYLGNPARKSGKTSMQITKK